MYTGVEPAHRGRVRPRLQPLFVLYIVAFHLLWMTWPFALYPRLQVVGDATLTYAVLNLTVRLLFWVAPVIAYCRYVGGVNPLQYLKLTGHVRRGIVVAIVLTAVNVAGTFLRFGPPHLSMQRVTWNSMLGTSFLIGFIEEIPYRGFMLRKFSERCDFWIANLITSLLFLSIHLPGWIALHTMNVLPAISVFVLGFILGVAVKVSDSLWAAIVTHSANDCLAFVVFGL